MTWGHAAWAIGGALFGAVIRHFIPRPPLNVDLTIHNDPPKESDHDRRNPD